MAFGEFYCPYCEALDFEDQDEFFEHVSECQFDTPTESLFGEDDED